MPASAKHMTAGRTAAEASAVPHGVACKTATGNRRPVARQNRSGFSSEVYRAVTVLYFNQVVDLCQAALDDLREALQALIAEVGIPDELTLTLNVA